MQAKKRVSPVVDIRVQELKPTPRPVGMQAMGPTLYEQIRRVLLELDMGQVPRS